MGGTTAVSASLSTITWRSPPRPTCSLYSLNILWAISLEWRESPPGRATAEGLTWRRALWAQVGGGDACTWGSLPLVI